VMLAAKGWELSPREEACAPGTDLDLAECTEFAAIAKENGVLMSPINKPEEKHDGCTYATEDKMWFNSASTLSKDYVHPTKTRHNVCLKEPRSTAQGPSSVTFEECTVQLS